MTIYEGGIEAFREKSRQEARERHEKQKKLQEEQRAREQAEREAAKLPFHEEMKQLVNRARVEIDHLQPGDIYATAKLKAGLRDAFTTLQYLLAALDSDRNAQKPPQEAAAAAGTGQEAAGR